MLFVLRLFSGSVYVLGSLQHLLCVHRSLHNANRQTGESAPRALVLAINSRLCEKQLTIPATPLPRTEQYLTARQTTRSLTPLPICPLL